MRNLKIPKNNVVLMPLKCADVTKALITEL